MEAAKACDGERRAVGTQEAIIFLMAGFDLCHHSIQSP
jgi:hypothetical protein